MFVDYHIHTEFSDDSEYEMEQVVKDAIAMGMEEICFTDHVDYGIKRDWDDESGMLYRRGGKGEPEFMPLANVDYPRYFEKISRLRKNYEGQIRIKQGMEFGIQSHTIAEYEKLFSGYPFDFIILSVHQIENKEFWNGEFQRELTRSEYYRKYYSEMLTLVETFHNYSVLGHMDLISRYDKEGEFSFEEVRPIIRRILQTVIEDGKGIEINTSCYRYGLTDLTPGREILKMYRELGGRIITIGSDSHKREHLGDHIPETLAQLKEMGFESVCTFDRMQPVFHQL
ncbi:MAG: histidinol-phosphatase HisJ family protein [Eubacteriales bacterium]|nr:histidinol-phosphatase HisJ family protein [Eubacteriales bacterium]